MIVTQVVSNGRAWGGDGVHLSACLGVCISSRLESAADMSSPVVAHSQ